MQSLWMLVAALLFAVMGACVKLAASPAGGGYSVAEIVLYRSLLGALALGVFVRHRGLSLASPVMGMHLRRGAVGTAALALWFFSTTALPLGAAMTLNYSSSLFLAAFVVAAALASGGAVRWSLALTVLIGFVGVVLVLQPSFSADQSHGVLAGLASGILSAAAYWHVKRLGQLGEPEWRTVFYFCLTGAVLALAASALTGFTRHSAIGVALLAAIGVTATVAQLAMTRAFAAGRTLLTANLQYSAIVFASVLGVIVFGDRIAPAGWLGIVIIIGSGTLATWITARAAQPIEPMAEK